MVAMAGAPLPYHIQFPHGLAYGPEESVPHSMGSVCILEKLINTVQIRMNITHFTVHTHVHN